MTDEADGALHHDFQALAKKYNEALVEIGRLEKLATPVEFHRDLMRALSKVTTGLGIVANNLEDEGDRVYLGSTMDADVLREAFHEMESYGWAIKLKKERSENVFASCREANARAERAEAALAGQAKRDVLAERRRQILIESLTPEAETTNSATSPINFNELVQNISLLGCVGSIIAIVILLLTRGRN